MMDVTIGSEDSARAERNLLGGKTIGTISKPVTFAGAVGSATRSGAAKQ